MSDLGLDSLGDDQLISLLAEAVQELVCRDPAVQRVAQGTVQTIAEKRTQFLDIVRSEVASAQASYLENLRQHVRSDIAAAVASGEINIPGMLKPGEEASVIVEVTQQQIKMIKDDLKRAPERSSFSVSYDGRSKRLRCSYHSAGQNWDANRDLSGNGAVTEQVRKAVMGAFGIPTE